VTKGKSERENSENAGSQQKVKPSLPASFSETLRAGGPHNQASDTHAKVLGRKDNRTKKRTRIGWIETRRRVQKALSLQSLKRSGEFGKVKEKGKAKKLREESEGYRMPGKNLFEYTNCSSQRSRRRITGAARRKRDGERER